MASKSFSAKCGHIKRVLSQNEPLKNKQLALALEIIDSSKMPGDNSLLDQIKNKLTSGLQLSEYEYHIFVEILLDNKKLEA